MSVSVSKEHLFSSAGKKKAYAFQLTQAKQCTYSTVPILLHKSACNYKTMISSYRELSKIFPFQISGNAANIFRAGGDINMSTKHLLTSHIQLERARRTFVLLAPVTRNIKMSMLQPKPALNVKHPVVIVN